MVWGLCARSALFCCHELGEGGRFGRDYPRLAARRASALWVGLRAPGGGRRVWPSPDPHWPWPSRHASDLTPPPPPSVGYAGYCGGRISVFKAGQSFLFSTHSLFAFSILIVKSVSMYI